MAILEQKIEETKRRMNRLVQSAATFTQTESGLLQEAIVELSTSLEELRVSQEELQQQNEELIAGSRGA